MSERQEMSEREAEVRALGIIERELNGLKFNEARWVLSFVGIFLDNTHRVDASNPTFAATAEEFRAVFAAEA